jgi:flagellar FliL protein
MADETAGEAPPKKKSGLVVTIIAVLAVTVVGGGGGWFVGKMLAPEVEPPKVAKNAEEAAVPEGGDKKEEGLPKLATEENGIIQLEPITTNLAFPTERWVRLEVALLFKQKPDARLAEAIHQDIAVYLRTVSLQQIEGPRGFEYLRDDIQERVDLRAQGRVSKVMFRTFVIE